MFTTKMSSRQRTKRAEHLEREYGIEVVRFSNEEVMTSTREVLEEIWKICSVK